MIAVGRNKVHEEMPLPSTNKQKRKKMDDSTESTDWEDPSVASGLRNVTNREGSTINTVNKEMKVHKDDLAQVLDFAQTELFEKVKFLYNQDEDLEVGGIIFWLFVRARKARLRGLAELKDADKRSMYVRMLWAEANKRSANLVSKGLHGKRNSVYTSVANKFTGKAVEGVIV